MCVACCLRCVHARCSLCVVCCVLRAVWCFFVGVSGVCMVVVAYVSGVVCLVVCVVYGLLLPDVGCLMHVMCFWVPCAVCDDC